MGPLATTARILRIAAILLGVLLVVSFVWVVVARLIHPIEAEWMTGAMHDGIARVAAGKPLFAPPTAEFASFLYPPLYPWVAAAFATVLPLPVAAKVVSLGATAAIGWGIWRLSRARGANRFWCTAAVLLHFGAYSLTLFFYDLARVDAFASALVVLALVAIDREASDFWTALGGALLGLAFFAKQPGLLVFAATVLGLYTSAQKRRAAIAGGAGAVVLALGATILHRTTDGWFWFYCWKLPAAHGLDLRYVTTFFVVDAPRAFLLFAASVAAIVLSVRSPRDRVLGCVLLSAMVGAFAARAHRGGYPNVLLVWTPLACVAVASVASRIQNDERSEVMLLAATIFQLGAWVFDPHDLGPVAEDVAREQRLRAYVRVLERDGDVWVATTGHLTRVRHLHAASLFDITDANEPPPPDLAAAIEERRFVAVLFRDVDEPSCGTPSCQALRDAIARNYFVAGHFLRSARRTDGKVGFDGRPRWILRPRKTPLAKIDAEVRRRELALAVERAWEAGEDQLSEPDDSIEVRAKVRTF